MTRFAALCSVKSEAPYIIEWVAHYRALGFDTIVIAQNDSVDGTAELLAALDAAGWITFLENSDPAAVPEHLRHFPAQRCAYGWAQTLPQVAEADYMFPLDIDEFLELPKDENFAALVDRLEQPDAISMPWRMFGSNGQTAFDPAPVAQRFTKANAKDDYGTARAFNQVKTAFRPDLTEKFNVHRPVVESTEAIRWVSPDGADVGNTLRTGNQLRGFDYGFANLRHYHVKSLAEFKVKMLRGYASHGTKKQPNIGLPAFDLMDVNTVELPMPDTTKADALAKEMRADTSVKAAENAALATFRKVINLASELIDKHDFFKMAPAFQAELGDLIQKEVYDRL